MSGTKRKQDEPGSATKKPKKVEVAKLSAFYQKLIETSVDVYKPANDTVFIAMRTDSLTEVCRGILKHGYLSVPVLQKTEHKWYGFLDLADCVRYILEHCPTESKVDDFWEVVKAQEALRTAQVNDALRWPLSRENPFHPIHRGSTLFAAFEALGRERQLHRVPIVDKDRKITNLITESSLLAFVHQHADLLGEAGQVTVEAMRFRSETVFSVSEDSKTLAAFQLCQEKGVTGCAVVDADGKLVGALSAKDIRSVGADGRNLHRLFHMTVKNFLAHVRQDHSGADERPRRLTTVKKDTTLVQLVAKLVEQKIHRVFLVDEATHKPLSVVSIHDVLRELLP